MKKKVRKIFKKRIVKELLNLKNAFSLVEIAVSLLVISVIIAALTPTISKRMSSSSLRSKVSTNCDSSFPDGYCALCDVGSNRCITCTRSCNTDEYKNSDKCICEACVTKHSDSYCAACNSKECTMCAQGYYINSLTGKCTKCPAGYRCYQEDGASVKVACQAGTYSTAGASVCTKCSESTSSSAGTISSSSAQSACTTCPDGKYAASAGATSCSVCTKGYYCVGGKYIPCAKGTANNTTGATACTSCVASTSTVVGTVAVQTAQTACTSCTNGSYAKSAGQTSACVTCPVGYYCPGGKKIACAKGTANNTTGATACTSCVASTSTVAGTYASSTAQSLCTTCPNGKYASSAGASSCTTCPSGYYCIGGMKIPCPKGSYCPNTGMSSATACPKGNYSSSTNATSCTPCAKGTYTSNTGNSECSKCSAGKYAPSTGMTACSTCPAGQYSSSAGSSACSTCASGKYSAAGASACSACTNWHEKCTACNASGCTTCASGYEVDGTGCKVSFDCEEEGGTIDETKNICWKFITLPSGVKLDTSLTSIYCGSSWREPSEVEGCLISSGYSIHIPMLSQGTSVYNHKSSTYKEYIAEASMTQVSHAACSKYVSSSSQCRRTTYYTLVYSPAYDCAQTYVVHRTYCGIKSEDGSESVNSCLTSNSAVYSYNLPYIGCVHDME